MDDSTWRKRMAARRRRRKIERGFVIFLFVMFIGSVIWYFVSYTKTPAYSMQETIQAFHEKDVANYRNRLELPSITARAYDDLTVDLFKYDTQLSEHERSLFENFYVLIRTQMCQGAIKVINKKFDGGEWTLPEEMLKGRQLGIDFDLLLERSLIRHTTIIDIDNVIHNGNTATADVKIMEDYSQIPFTLKVTLQDFSNASWQVGQKIFQIGQQSFTFPGMSFTLGKSDWRIVSINNYREYLDAVNPTLQKDLGDYIDATAEIISRYNESFRVEQSAFITMQRTTYGIMDDNQRGQIATYINQVIIPMRQYRQNELDAVPIPAGATYLANLRKESTAMTIAAWQAYAKGLIEDNSAAFDTAESLHKQELALDQRIEEIVHNSAVARNLPELP